LKILITGAGGMLGTKLLQKLAVTGQICGHQISSVHRHDIVLAPPPPPSAFAVSTSMSDFSLPGEALKLIQDRPDLIFHLAAVVSGEAEADFDKGYRINLDGTRMLFEAIRGVGESYKPKLVFTSSIAVFGGPFPDAIDDEWFTTPLTSYGTQKAIGELLLADYSRRGIFDGIGVRMPTVCVRPGKPNKAASGFFSGIIREPLNGQTANLPVDESVRHWHVSPRSAIQHLIRAAELDTHRLGNRRNLTLPGLSCTVGEQIEALRRIAGPEFAKLVVKQPDSTIIRIVGGWPQNFDARRAQDLGFTAESSFEDIIKVHIDDELGGRVPELANQT
jgi:D-erythronate 2-dehydrogenase